MNPKISVVIPAYNEERLIEACLNSLKAQDFLEPVEVIVVDNSSSDNTGALASKLGAKVVFEPQRGVCAARQAGTEMASGQIVVSTDADTVFPCNWLSRIWAGFTDHPDVVAVAGACEYVNAPWWARLYTNALFGSTNARYVRTGTVGYISACNTAFRKDAWAGYNVKLTQGGDEFDLLFQLKKKGRILFQRNNIVFTSSRRIHLGIWYNVFITILWYYGCNYLIGRMTGKSPLGSYSPIRNDDTALKRPMRWVQTATVILVMVFAFSLATHRVSASRLLHGTTARLDMLEDKIHFHRIR